MADTNRCQSHFTVNAGAQEKTGLLWYQNQWHLPLGSTPTSHILKLPIGELAHQDIDLSQSCENEWLCLHIAQAYGLPVCKSEILHFGDNKVLAVERFDRRWSKDGSWLMRLPQEDMCQALGIAPANKYESDGGPGIAPIMAFLLGSQQPIEDRKLFFKAQILFWLLAAIDGHAKNFSAFIEQGSGFRLTPLYDIMSAYPVLNPNFPKQKLKMAMALTGKSKHYRWSRVQPRHFYSTAKKVGFPEAMVTEMMADMKEKTAKVIEQVTKILPDDFPAHISQAIFEGLRKQAARLP